MGEKDGKSVSCTNTDQGCCFVSKITATTFSWVSNFDGINEGRCGERIAAKADGSKVYAYAKKLLAEFDGTTGAITRSMNVSWTSRAYAQASGMVVIGTDLYAAFTFMSSMTVGPVTVDGVTSKQTTAVFKISLTSWTVTGVVHIGNSDDDNCMVRSMEPAHNSTTGALVLSLTAYSSNLQFNGTTVKTFGTETALGYSVSTAVDWRQQRSALTSRPGTQIAVTVVLSKDLKFVSANSLGGNKAADLVEDMAYDESNYSASDPYNKGTIFTVGKMERTFDCSTYNGSEIGQGGAFFLTRYNATNLVMV